MNNEALIPAGGGRPAYSVLLSVYAGENAEYLLQSVRSIYAQTWKPESVILVCDGPLTGALERAVGSLAEEGAGALRLVRLGRNAGLGPALNAGLAACGTEYVARMDTDDIAVPTRCERQLSFMIREGVDLCSAAVLEFSDDPARPAGMKRLPLEHDEIVAYARERNPINHPCAMFRKGAVLAAGGYRDMPLFEDYDLWMRMILRGARLGNLPDALVYMRAGPVIYRRRGGLGYCRALHTFWRAALESGFISGSRYRANLAARCLVSILPNPARSSLYRNFLRRK